MHHPVFFFKAPPPVLGKCPEGSTSFRLLLLCFRSFLLTYVLLCFFLSDAINKMNHVATKGELFGSSFEMFGTDIDLKSMLLALDARKRRMLYNSGPAR